MTVISVGLQELLILFFAAFLSPVETDDAGLMAFRILRMFQAVLAQCPTVANASSVASPALSPYLVLNNNNNSSYISQQDSIRNNACIRKIEITCC